MKIKIQFTFEDIEKLMLKELKRKGFVDFSPILPYGSNDDEKEQYKDCALLFELYAVKEDE